ncbi:Hypothetical protein D9617_9g025100 [Elsinoe fawcettii]|nr:Hypothetical protein D9617_9g025100 [Elsinoe fawcettii]
MTTKSIPLPSFTSLTPHILFSHRDSTPASLDPALIVLCTWVSASRRNIAKYTSHYAAHYQHTPQPIIESTVTDMVFGTDASQFRAFAPARDLILSTLSASGPGSVLLHVFSNGGAQTASRLLKSIPEKERLQALRAVVFDSCPGKGTLQRSVDAMLFSLPRTWFFAIFGRAIVCALCALLWMMEALFGVENVVSVARRRLLGPRIVGRHVPRVYMYGMKDKMVWWQDVQEHAEEARDRGYIAVDEVKFEDGDHCAYIMRDGDKYWKTVQNIVGTGRRQVN